VVGIVASRLVDHYHKPAILFSTPDGQPSRGSARSVEGLNITAAIAAQKELLLNFGGHPMAAGLSLEKEKLDEFRRRLSSTVTEMMQGIQIERNLEIDGWLSLPEAGMELAAALERLAPYGPGNEKLTLATSGLKIQSKTSIGRNQEHLKLNVSDEAGNSRSVLWWNGAGEKDTLPEGRLDLAYSLRASDWRGTPQVQMEFVDFRKTAGQPVEVKNSQYEVIDYRNAQEPSQILSTLREQSTMLVWAEGQEKKRVGGCDRYELAPADALAIWSIPPSPLELQLAMEIVQPRKVYLFSVSDPVEQPDALLEKLAGLLKYAINHRGGRITWSALETVTIQRSVTIRRGLAWLVSQGMISIQSEEGDNLTVMAGTIPEDRPDSTSLKTEIQALLDETSAYRQHFKHAGKDTLFFSPSNLS
jgi:single-stranded-DNA-specific exonuclease